MKASRIVLHLLRLATRTVRHRVVTPIIFTLSITLTFVLVFRPSLLLHKHPTQRSGASNVLQVRKGLLLTNLAHSSGASNESVSTTAPSQALSKDGKYHVTVIPRGRLGNQMFEYASLLGIADVNNRELFVSSSCVVTHYFANVTVSDRPVAGWQVLEELNYAQKDSSFDSLPPENIKIKGFLQSWKYFANVSQKVRESFVFFSDVQERIQLLFANYTQNLTADVIKIGVHVRRTDMLHKMTQKQGYVPAPLSYIQKAIQHMQVRFGNESTFFVVSDDLEWCTENLVGNRVEFVDPAPSVVHLGFLAMCDHVIMTVGTFGWWAAYLAGGHVVYYDGYPRAGSEIAEGFKKEDFFLPEWVPIGD